MPPPAASGTRFLTHVGSLTPNEAALRLLVEREHGGRIQNAACVKPRCCIERNTPSSVGLPYSSLAVEIIRSLVDHIVFRPAVDAGLEIELVGDIAKMVIWSNPTKTAPFLGLVTMSSLVR